MLSQTVRKGKLLLFATFQAQLGLRLMRRAPVVVSGDSAGDLPAPGGSLTDYNPRCRLPTHPEASICMTCCKPPQKHTRL